MRVIICVLLAMGVFKSTTAQINQTSRYTVVYEADRDGSPLSGNLDELINHINDGNPVRVGWELVTLWPDTTVVLTHWTDGGFLTILRGHVFAQIRGIFGQGAAHIDSPPGVFFSSDQPNSWVGIVGTNGILRSKFYLDEWLKGLSEDEIKSMETMQVKTKWAVLDSGDSP